MPLIPAMAVTRVLSKAKGLLRSPAFWAALVILAVGTGTFFYLRADKKEAVSAATTTADSKATTKTFETKDTINTRNQAVDQVMDAKRIQTVKDYAHVREKLTQSPAQDRNAQASPVLIDTLNELDRLRAARDPLAVPDADLPVG